MSDSDGGIVDETEEFIQFWIKNFLKDFSDDVGQTKLNLRPLPRCQTWLSRKFDHSLPFGLFYLAIAKYNIALNVLSTMTYSG